MADQTADQIADRIADRAALLDLAHAYAQHADRREPELLGALFEDDGVLRIIRHGAEDAPVVRTGRDEIVAAVRRLDRYDLTFHFVGNHRYDIAADTATGEVYCIAHHVSGEAGNRRDHVMMIRYHDGYRRGGDGWRIVERELHVDWTEDRAVID